MPGVRLNLGMRGASVSVGGRGGRLTFGPRGTTASAGIPGTGISFRQRLSSSAGSRAAPQRRGIPEETIPVTFDLAADGKVTVSSDGQPLPPKYVRMAFEQQGTMIEDWLQSQADGINQTSKDLLDIHLTTPPPVYRSRFKAHAFTEPQPDRPPFRAFSAEKPSEPLPDASEDDQDRNLQGDRASRVTVVLWRKSDRADCLTDAASAAACSSRRGP